MQEPVPGISAVPDEANARYFHVVVAGNFSTRKNNFGTYMIISMLFLYNSMKLGFPGQTTNSRKVVFSLMFRKTFYTALKTT